ncbi:MAG: PDZ domain-containing protein, partial [Acidimicrobiales bacterium]
GGAVTGRLPVPILAADAVGDVSPDLHARGSALEVRGSIVWLPHRDGPARHLGGGGGVRGRLPRVLTAPDSPEVVFVTDAEGEDALEITPALVPVPVPARRVGVGAIGRVLQLTAAPDGTRVGLATHDGRVLVVEIESGEVVEIDRSPDGDANGLTFSPDSAWLAWSHAGPEPLRHIKVARVAGDGQRDVIEVTPLRFNDHDPVFTLDAKYLAFLSARTFDPVYDSHVFDLFFPAGTRPYLVALGSNTPSPFDAELAGRAPHPPEESKRDQTEEKEENDATAPAITVELDGIAQRVVPVPVPAARYSELRAADGGLVWLHEPMMGVLGDELAQPGAEHDKPSVLRYDFEKRRMLTLIDAAESVAMSGDGKSIVASEGDHLFIVPSTSRAEPAPAGAEGPSGRIEIDTDRIRLQVDPELEWRQMYDEAARIMRDHYWIADMADVDWDEVVERYRPLLGRVATRDDLSELFWEVQGELGTSHAYEEPPPRPVDDLRRLGLLGADIDRGDDGRWRVRRVFQGESSVLAARAPLLAPGASVGVGEI